MEANEIKVGHEPRGEKNTDFRLSLQWLLIDFSSVLGLLHLVIVNDYADVSDIHAASIFKEKYVG
jgi:hypothetical protein